MSLRTEVRKKSYKTGVDGDEARRRREDNLVEIRKNKQEDNLLKKRREGLLQAQQPTELSQAAPGIEKKVFEDIRKEYWYKPQVLVYAGMIKVLANNGLFEMVERVFLYMKMESNLEADLEAFNALLQTFMDFSIVELVMECFHLMKVVECEPDKSTFKILINGLESKGETGLSTIVRQEAKKYYGGSLEFLQEKEDTSLICN